MNSKASDASALVPVKGSAVFGMCKGVESIAIAPMRTASRWFVPSAVMFATCAERNLFAHMMVAYTTQPRWDLPTRKLRVFH
jgi:hypothetical protein